MREALEKCFRIESSEDRYTDAGGAECGGYEVGGEKVTGGGGVDVLDDLWR